MNKTQLIECVAEEANVTKKVATETVEAMINTMLGTPKQELISDLNEIIRGI